MTVKPVEDLTLNAIAMEVIKARIKFPNNKHLLAALMEEVGELAQALLENKDRDEWEKEAIQVACVAIRIIEEGDSSFLTHTELKSQGSVRIAEVPVTHISARCICGSWTADGFIRNDCPEHGLKEEGE